MEPLHCQKVVVQQKKRSALTRPLKVSHQKTDSWPPNVTLRQAMASRWHEFWPLLGHPDPCLVFSDLSLDTLAHSWTLTDPPCFSVQGPEDILTPKQSFKVQLDPGPLDMIPGQTWTWVDSAFGVDTGYSNAMENNIFCVQLIYCWLCVGLAQWLIKQLQL